MTSAVFSLLERAAESGGDFAHIWHDILWMSRVRPVRLLSGGHTFQVRIQPVPATRGRELKIVFHGGDYGEPCATVMLPDED